jgi:hypothetical protein
VADGSADLATTPLSNIHQHLQQGHAFGYTMIERP